MASGCCAITASQEAVVSPTAISTVLLSPSACHFFASFNWTSTEFLALGLDGRYILVDREHMFTEISDEGTWRQGSDGVVELSSTRHCRDVETASLAVFLWHSVPGKQGKAVEAIAGFLTQFLASNRCGTFAASEVREIYRYSSPAGADYSVSAIDLLGGEGEDGSVPRGDLEALLAAIEDFAFAKDVGVFRFTPLRFAETTFVEWQNTRSPYERDRRQLIGMLRARAGNSPSMVFTAISRNLFEAEAGTTQPFLFYREMNAGRGREELSAAVELTRKCVARP